LVRPLLLMTPPAVGAKSPADLLELARFAWKLKGLDVQGTGDFVKVMTLSVAELLDEWFESPQVKAARCVSGAIGTYGGPYTPGTAYVLLHHYIGEVAGQLPADFVRAIDHYKTRSGTVKVNLALGEPPRFHGLAEDDSNTAARSFIQLCDSMEYLERAFDDAKYGRASAEPYSDGVLPTLADYSLA